MIQRTMTTSVTKRLSNTQNEPESLIACCCYSQSPSILTRSIKSRKTGTIATGLRTNTTKNI